MAFREYLYPTCHCCRELKTLFVWSSQGRLLYNAWLNITFLPDCDPLNSPAPLSALILLQDIRENEIEKKPFTTWPGKGAGIPGKGDQHITTTGQFHHSVSWPCATKTDFDIFIIFIPKETFFGRYLEFYGDIFSVYSICTEFNNYIYLFLQH